MNELKYKVGARFIVEEAFGPFEKGEEIEVFQLDYDDEDFPYRMIGVEDDSNDDWTDTDTLEECCIRTYGSITDDGVNPYQ